MNSKHQDKYINFFLSTDILSGSKEVEEILRTLNQDGSHLYKVRGASKWFRRKFTLDINEMAMKYEPSRSKTNCFQKQKKNSKLSLKLI